MSPDILVTLLILSLFVGLLLGVPLAFLTGGIGVLFILLIDGHPATLTVVLLTLDRASNFILLAIPLFIFMGVTMEKSGIAEDLYDAFRVWLGSVRGGLGMATTLICTIFGAMVGIAGAAVVSMGLIALPNMLKYKYDKRIALGIIAAGGTLGQIIPPSVLMVIYGLAAGVSIGKLFAGGIVAGLLLSALFITYIGIRSSIQKDLCPRIVIEEKIPLKDKFRPLVHLVLPAFIVILVLGSIFLGIAAPSEAAAVGCFGAVLSALVRRRLNWQVIRSAALSTIRVNGMVMWVIFGATCFGTVFARVGGPEILRSIFSALPFGDWSVIIGTMLIVFILGMFLDPNMIIIIVVPIVVPTVASLGFDPIWFGILFAINLQMSFITPPFGYSLFYLKGVAPPGISIADIYISVWPFVALQATGMIILMIFPQPVLWFVDLVIR